MKSKHTPGPWTIGGSMIGGRNTDADRVSIARILRRPAIHGGLVYHFPDTATDAVQTGAEADANARLIAAAPDLLAALEGLVAILNDGGWIGDNPEPGSPGYIARAAIAKARGE